MTLSQLSDLQLGDKRVTSNRLVHVVCIKNSDIMISPTCHSLEKNWDSPSPKTRILHYPTCSVRPPWYGEGLCKGMKPQSSPGGLVVFFSSPILHASRDQIAPPKKIMVVKWLLLELKSRSVFKCCFPKDWGFCCPKERPAGKCMTESFSSFVLGTLNSV